MLSRLFVFAALLASLAACTKVSPALQLFFVGSARFTAGNRTGVGAGDTLATRLYATDSTRGNGLRNMRITVTYSPTRQPFVYPVPLTAFVYTNLPTAEQVVYLDSTLSATTPPHTFLLTTVFGARTTSGAEHWEYVITGADGSTSSRSFTATVRRPDSLAVYHDYFLRLNVPARGPSARRFVQLKSGLALPAYTVVGTSSNPTPSQQRLVDMVQSVDGLQLFSPDTLATTRWGQANRRATRFRLTPLDATGFSGVQDTIGIRQQYTQSLGRVRQALRGLAANQVYAFRTTPLNGARSTFGLLRVVSTPGGSTAGLQLEIRTGKQAPADAFAEQ